jgi:dihydroflavonol-4-reductase
MADHQQPLKALVTGGTGFVGSHLVDLLVERGYSVRCLVRESSNRRYLKAPELEFVFGGLDSQTDWDAALDGVDVVYHVAGLTFARRSSDYFRVNQRGTEEILSAVLKHRSQIKRFVYISSQAAVGPARGGTPVNEATDPKPISPYGESKLMGEEAVRAVRDLIDFCIVRPPAVYGPRDYAILEIFKSVARGVAPTIGPYDMQFSLVHVRDLAEGILLAGESNKSSGRTYFISSDMVYSMSAVNKLLSNIVGKPIRNFAIPRAVAYTVAVAAEGVAAITRRPPIINRDKVRDFSQSCWGCSIDAAKRDLGYRQRVPIESGLRDTYEWYKRERWL